MMKHVMGVSLGSSSRDHVVELNVLGHKVKVERRGTDGDVREAIRLVQQYDGRVDAFGIGGIDRYIYAGKRRYTLRDGERIARAARQTPIVDGSGLKDSLERWVIPHLESEGLFSFAKKRVLLVVGVDRFGMAETLTEIGSDVRFGDLAFTLGFPYIFQSLRGLDRLARIVAPIVQYLPAHWLYPTGERQTENKPKYGKYYDWAQVIAGDFILIKRYMPMDMSGKVILTNTVTAPDIAELQRRGVSAVVTTTPDLNGRSFGTNVMEAILVAVADKVPNELEPQRYIELLQRMNFHPRIIRFDTQEQHNAYGMVYAEK